jgi:hypothetical protein
MFLPIMAAHRRKYRERGSLHSFQTIYIWSTIKLGGLEQCSIYCNIFNRCLFVKMYCALQQSPHQPIITLYILGIIPYLGNYVDYSNRASCTCLKFPLFFCVSLDLWSPEEFKLNLQQSNIDLSFVATCGRCQWNIKIWVYVHMLCSSNIDVWLKRHSGIA